MKENEKNAKKLFVAFEFGTLSTVFVCLEGFADEATKKFSLGKHRVDSLNFFPLNLDAVVW